jgi:hypothetical protein
MHPKLVSIGAFYLPTYGVMLAIAYLVAIALLTKKAEREGLPKNEISDLSIAILAAAILGAKLLLAIVDFKEYLADPSSASELIRSGGVFQGGIGFRRGASPTWPLPRSRSARRSDAGDASRRDAATGSRRTCRGRSRSAIPSPTRPWERR